ncbi:MAG: TfoX/Sxy family protein [Bauldia sp.]
MKNSSPRRPAEGTKSTHGADTDLVERIRAIVAGPGVTEQRMFGGVCFMLNGNMVAGTLRGDLLLRVGPDGFDAALRAPHARPMEHGGRPTAGYVIVAIDGLADDRVLLRWIDRARAHVASLPVKKKAPAKSRKGAK